MSVTDAKTIDMWGVPKWDNTKIILGIADDLEWGDKAEQGKHLLVLQEKINNYIAFIESGEIYTEIPGAKANHLSSGFKASTSYPSKASYSFIALPRHLRTWV